MLSNRACRTTHSWRDIEKPAEIARIVTEVVTESLTKLMPMVAREVLLCAGLARAVAGGQPAANAMRDARIWESKQATYRRALDRHPPSRWEVFAAECGRIDRCAKGRGDGDPWQLLERLLLALADPRARGLVAP